MVFVMIMVGIPNSIAAEQRQIDFRHRRCITYETENAGWEDKLRDDLSKTIQVINSDTGNAEELDWPYDTNSFQNLHLECSDRLGRLQKSSDTRCPNCL
jgi:hypothetical protein